MIRSLTLGICLTYLSMTAVITQAHFAFVVPTEDGLAANVIMSETLHAEDGLEVKILNDVQLMVRDEQGNDVSVTALPNDKNSLRIDVPGSGLRVIHGLVDLGIVNRGPTPHWLRYHPKTILGDAGDSRTIIGENAPIEIVPVVSRNSSEFRLQVRVNGRVQPETELTIIHPSGDQEKLFTDGSGMTQPVTNPGRYGAWARHWDRTSGEHNGKPYDEIRHYGLLVFDFASQAVATAPTETTDTTASAPATTSAKPTSATINRWADLPFATASFGAEVLDGWLYLYGGHVAPTHEYHTKSASGELWRMDLASRGAWRQLPSGPALQGMNLTSYNGCIYRVGGMASINDEDKPSDNRSVTSAQRFDPATMSWTDIAPLPEPRSSHDVVVVGTNLYVIGGWHMQADKKIIWHTRMLSIDLADPNAGWVEHSQPFIRRALIAAVLDQHIYVMGGFNESAKPSRRVEVFDTIKGRWSEGPDLPGDSMNGFAPASCVQDRRLFVSVGDGGLYRLNPEAKSWEWVADTTPRIVHRMAPIGSQVLVLGGASKGDNLDLLEAVAIKQTSSPVTSPVQLKETIAAAAFHRKPAKDVAKNPHSDETSRATKPTEKTPTTNHAQHPALAGQQYCPIMTDERIDTDCPTATYKGRRVAVCCDTCLTKWYDNPDEYASIANLPQLEGVEIPRRKLAQTYCPVFSNRVVTESDPYVIYQGKRVYVFNSAAKRRWNKNPEKYANRAILPQLAVTDSGGSSAVR